MNGLIFDQSKPEEIAQKAELLLNNANFRRKIGEEAYAYVKNHLSWEKYARTMETIFEESITYKQKNLDINYFLNWIFPCFA